MTTAFETVNAHREVLCRWAMSSFHLSPEDASDAVSDVLLYASQHWNECRTPERPLPWLRMILKNHILKTRAKRTRETVSFDLDLRANTKDWEPVQTVSKKFCAFHSYCTMRFGPAVAEQMYSTLTYKLQSDANVPPGTTLAEHLSRWPVMKKQFEQILTRLGFDDDRPADLLRGFGYTVPVHHTPHGEWSSLVPPRELGVYRPGSWLYVRFGFDDCPLSEDEPPPEVGQAWLYQLLPAMMSAAIDVPGTRKHLSRMAEATPEEIGSWEMFRNWGATCPELPE
ncbi:MAG: sigma-70 family RNA polymerase sigma factor [Gemmataceae bacterium]